MHNFSKKLLTEWRRLALPTADSTFIVAVSGGADSVSLMLALGELQNLQKLRLRLVIAHFNHNLRGVESDADEQYVKSLTSKFGFELVLGGEKIPSCGNLEQNARRLRYDFLARTAVALHAEGVLTAHTMNDQAETLLANLIRGSGLEGLGGMKPIRKLGFDGSAGAEQFSRLKLVRPLLNWANRQDTENFCLLNETHFRHDSMNEDLTFNRVRIRKILIPLLEDFNPKTIENLAKTASMLREDYEFLESAARVGAECEPRESFSAQSKAKSSNISESESLELKELKNLFPSMRRQIVRDWLKIKRGDLRKVGSRHIEAIESLIFSRKSGRKIELPDGATVVKQKGKLTFVARKG